MQKKARKPTFLQTLDGTEPDQGTVPNIGKNDTFRIVEILVLGLRHLQVALVEDFLR